MLVPSRRRTVATALVALAAAIVLSVTPAEARTDTSQVVQQQASVDVAVFARGSTGTERLELRIGSRTVATFTLTTRLREYNYSTPDIIGRRSLSVHFVNDAGNRNVTIDRVHVNDTQFQTEAPSVEMVGAFTNGSCQPLGNYRTEHIPCSGYARFDIGDSGRPRLPAPPAPKHTRAPFPRAGNNGQHGCIEPCRVVGFQDFDGQRNAVLENVIITNPGGPCLSIRYAENITIRNVTLRNCMTDPAVRVGQKKIINIVGSDQIRIVGSLLTDNASRSLSNHDLIHIRNSTAVKIYNNEIRNIASDTGGSNDRGNRAILVTGNLTENLIIDRNDFFSPGRNAVQISHAQGIANVRITRNRVEGRGPWDSDFEDMINFFSTSGTPESPIVVRKNYMRNGGPSATGTAIILGDGAGNRDTGYITVVRNTIVDPGHVGINVAGGHNFIVKHNTIYGAADVGEWTATGLIVNHFEYTPACRDHRIYGNRVFFRNQFPQHNAVNHKWITGTCTDNVRLHSNTFGDRTLSYRVWNI